MAINSVRTALQLLSGAGEVTRAKALEAAGTLLEMPGVGETSARAGQLAEELLEAATANQAMVSELVRTEVDGRLAFLGLARGSDLEAAQRKIDSLEREVADLRKQVAQNGASPTAGGSGSAGRADRSSVKKAAGSDAGTKPVKKTAKVPATNAAETSAKKSSPAKKSASTPPRKSASTSAKRTARKTAKKAPAKKASAKKTARKTAKNAPAKKSTPRTS